MSLPYHVIFNSGFSFAHNIKKAFVLNERILLLTNIFQSFRHPIEITN